MAGVGVGGTGCGSYSEDRFSVGPGDTQGVMGGKECSGLAGQDDGFVQGFTIYLYTCISSRAQPVGHISCQSGHRGVPLSARAPRAPCLGWEGPTSAASPGPVC